MPISVVVLAAGQGTRMRSERPKVLHELAGRPMLAHVLDTAAALDPAAVHVVHGHGGEAVRAALAGHDVQWVHQHEQLGTGHAVAQALPAIPDDHLVLVLCGDVPLTRPETLGALCEAAETGGGALLTVRPANPAGYGRVVRGDGDAVRYIVEEKDATAEQRAIGEVSSGLMCLPAGPLKAWLAKVGNDNAQGEYYLPDVIAMAAAEDRPVRAVATADEVEVQGVNDRVQLAAVERAWQRRTVERLMREQGLGVSDPARLDIRGRLDVGRDCRIDVNVLIEGDVTLGDGVRIGANCILRDSRIGAATAIEPFSLVERADVGEGCTIGPYARLRPGTALAGGAKVGNFVELKNAVIGPRSKVNHLSYVGDARLGEDVNVGAGTITCNYDGANKHRTEIGDRVFIGSNSALVAPVRIGDDATIGAGTTLRSDAAAGALTLTASREQRIDGWQRPAKKAPDET